jgi:hypothetical protein
MEERRQQTRLFDAELVMVSWKEPTGTAKQLGNVHNLSPEGAGVFVDQSISAGTLVTMSYDDGIQQLTGIVRHHAPLADRHLVGIEFDASSQDSPLHFQPEFLIEE